MYSRYILYGIWPVGKKCDKMAKGVIITADKVKKQKKFVRIVRMTLLTLLLLLIVVYIILQIIYNEGKFTITLDSNKTLESGIAIYESLDDTQARRKLEAKPISFMDNISWKWLPNDIDTAGEGSHNGENYIAYTYYVENQGTKRLNYWYEIELKAVVKNVDEAIRIMIFKNGEKTVYAKKNALSNEPEEDTIAFLEGKKETIVLERRENFLPQDRDRYTIVIYLEGDDPDCVDALKGGELKLQMKITEEHVGKE